uniref:Uncharacterized protein n=1 Tax=Magallana gigas TaxID=29159 RepID=A0A8W8NZX1_MAGGI
METTISVLVLVVALMGFPCRSIPNTDYTAYGTYNTYGGGGGSHSPYPGYPQGNLIINNNIFDFSGFCGGCVARFFVGRVNVTPFCGGSTPPGTPHHKKY